MLKILRIVFGLIASILAIYFLITDKAVVMPFMVFFLGVMFLVMGLSELQEKRKAFAYIIFLVSGFNIFISIYTSFS
ncbi:Protein of unknown function [Paenibacillus uliginis N3/975]|uniref:DUF3953 domain-containing protein n=1 Tax=Paenibacillus uliginis N3/975 TaxID=1313296 RepID=A0A1X7HHF2_9BACL|nr:MULTISPECIES: DUF3953 domain-containing protein [Paenibacillus]UNK20734.1 DUF3953 domain-containing protein [Paenibacillus sp. N3/727]SMF86755.1 Protein of unknown function [Paenibacillus uliginis N3/975]